ncbi:MAG: hypothetical protein OHK0029_34540 [Armatimonadaceae bacterium]
MDPHPVPRDAQNATRFSRQNPGGRPHPIVHLIGFIIVLVGVIVAHLFPPTDGSGWIRQFAKFWSHTGNDVFLTLSIGGLVYLAWREKSRLAFWRVAAPLLTETAIMQTVQKVSFHVFGLWPRPSGTDGGFPSGHTAASCVMAYLLTERYPLLAPVWYGIGALITWSRVEAGAHYPYQLIGGVILGFATVLLMVPRFYPRPVPPPNSPGLPAEDSPTAAP